MTKDYHPSVQDMTSFTDRSDAFKPASHKGRTTRERKKNAERITRRAIRDDPGNRPKTRPAGK